MTWWGWLLWIVVFAAVSAVLQPRLDRAFLRRRLRAGRVTVSAQGTTPDLGDWPPRWRLYRAVRTDGRTVLRRAGGHVSEPGIELLSVAGSGRPLPPRERLRAPSGSRRAVPFQTSAGLVEVAAGDEVLAWLQTEPAPAEDD